MLGERTINIFRRHARQTLNEEELIVKHLFKLSFRDPVPEEEDALGRLVGLFLLEIGSIVDELRDEVLRDNKSVQCHDYQNPVRDYLSHFSQVFDQLDPRFLNGRCGDIFCAVRVYVCYNGRE